MIPHPYPVTPLHGDYLLHVDLAESVAASLMDASQAAPAIESLSVKAIGAAARLLRREGAPESWDVEIERNRCGGAGRLGDAPRSTAGSARRN